MVEKGTHAFTLSGAADFQPPIRELMVEYTAAADPLKIVFEKIA